MSNQEGTIWLVILFTGLNDLMSIKLAVLLCVVESFREWLEFCFDTLDIIGFILAFDILGIFDVLVLLVVVDLFDFEKPVNLFIIAVLLIDIFVVILLLEQHIPQPSLHFIF